MQVLALGGAIIAAFALGLELCREAAEELGRTPAGYYLYLAGVGLLTAAGDLLCRGSSKHEAGAACWMQLACAASGA